MHFGMSRSYKVSRWQFDSWDKAMNFCQNLGLGLAIWDTTETYDDMKSISSKSALSWGMWTALGNTMSQSCDGANACDGKLVRRKNPWPTYIFSCHC